MMQPAPRRTTSGYTRVSDGLVTRSSRSMTARAAGPGNSVTIRGSASVARSSLVIEVILNSLQSLGNLGGVPSVVGAALPR